jgi:hypothetical protein
VAAPGSCRIHRWRVGVVSEKSRSTPQTAPCTPGTCQTLAYPQRWFGLDPVGRHGPGLFGAFSDSLRLNVASNTGRERESMNPPSASDAPPHDWSVEIRRARGAPRYGRTRPVSDGKPRLRWRTRSGGTRGARGRGSRAGADAERCRTPRRQDRAHVLLTASRPVPGAREPAVGSVNGPPSPAGGRAR